MVKMVGSEVSKLEELANQPGLVAPIEFTDGDNDSFIQAVQGWAASQGKETKEEVYKVGVMEAVKMSLRGIYNTFLIFLSVLLVLKVDGCTIFLVVVI